MMTIDGSRKSGSGTIVRDAVCFSAVTGTSVHITNIRARRRPPGLRPQHLTVIRAIATLSGGTLHGDAVGSREIRFTPGNRIRGGDFRFDIGTAGSTTMLASAVLPVALLAERPSRFLLTGGLFQDFAPSAFHFQNVLLPLLHRMGVNATLHIRRPGYVPGGGGELELTVRPLRAPLRPLLLTDQGSIQRVEGISLASHLKQRRVADRMADACETHLKHEGYAVHIDRLYDEPDNPAFRSPAPQAGAALAIWTTTQTGAVLGADMAGKLRRTSEYIGQQVARMFLEDVHTGAAVDRHLADQWIPFAALAQGTSRVRIPGVTDHVEARLWLAELFFNTPATIEGNIVTLTGAGISARR